MQITKEQLKQSTDDSYDIELTLDGKNIKLNLEPDDGTLEETLALTNNCLKDYKQYFRNAENCIVKDFLDNYNENWADEEEGFPELNEQEFRNNLEINAINFLSSDSIDIFFNDNDMFGGHSLIAQSSNGKTFDNSTMFG